MPGKAGKLSRTNSYLSGLNPQQQAAVLTADGPVLVVAGAGSGKTTVVTRRIAYLLKKKLAAPSQLLAVTFTNKAALEMRERAASLVGKRAAKDIEISTFHSFCLKVLRKHIELLGYRKNFTIADKGDSRTLLRHVLDDIEGVGERFSPAMFRAEISLRKGRVEGDSAEALKEGAAEKYETWMPEVYERYESALRAANSVDYDDLLSLTLRLWNEHPRILSVYQKKYRYVMVDEYQDTNPVQYDLIRRLVEKRSNLCVVGDDDQSIYGWRGADVRNILRFEKDYPAAKIVTLDQNYRSTRTILRAANAVISRNGARREKKMWSDVGEGRPIDWLVTGDDDHEAKMAVAWLDHIIGKTGARNGDFAILYRSNTQSRPFELALRQAGRPYVVIGGQDFFERAEVRDIVAYLKVLANPRDEASLLRVINVPRRGVGDASLMAVHRRCKESNVPFNAGLRDMLSAGELSPSARQGVTEFMEIVDRHRRLFRADGLSLSDNIRSLVNAIDYRDEVNRTSKTREQADFRWENVETVVKAVEQYESESGKSSLHDFLDQSSLNGDEGRQSKDEGRQNAVTLQTIHSAKGLEYPFVFVAGVEEGLLPHERSLKENSLDEERRLFYVAMTRAKRHLTLFEAHARVKHGRERMSVTSRFMEDIPAELITKRIHAARDMVEARVDPNKGQKKQRRKPARRR
jgi:DNA helicase-2/ATP-dependent DNA helicase PcrA